MAGMAAFPLFCCNVDPIKRPMTVTCIVSRLMKYHSDVIVPQLLHKLRSVRPCCILCDVIGAAGNLLVPISGMPENAFRALVGIDTVRSNTFFT
jgi:hypothetical protein